MAQIIGSKKMGQIEAVIDAAKKIVINKDASGTNVGVYKHLDMGTLVEFEDWQRLNEVLEPFKR